MAMAFARRDLVTQGDYPACSESIEPELWNRYKFRVLEAPCEDFETDEGFNLLIQHPLNGRTLFVCSIDFDFTGKV